MKKRTRKSFFDLTPEERDREVAEFDRELDLSKARPLTKKQQLLHAKADAKGKGKHVFICELDPKLLSEAAELARRRGIPLSKLVEQGVRGMLAFSR